MKFYSNFLLIMIIVCFILLSCIGCTSRGYQIKESIDITPVPILIGEKVTVDWSTLEIRYSMVDRWVIEFQENDDLGNWRTLYTTYTSVTKGKKVTFLFPCLYSTESETVKIRVIGLDLNGNMVRKSTTEPMQTVSATTPSEQNDTLSKNTQPA